MDRHNPRPHLHSTKTLPGQPNAALPHRRLLALGALAGTIAFHAEAQTTVQAWASANLLGSGPYVVLYGPNANAHSEFFGSGALASASSSAGGFMSSNGSSAAAGLSNGIGGLASVKYNASFRGPSGASIPATIGYSVDYTTDAFTEFVASSIPQSVADVSVDYSVTAGGSTVKGHSLETWQNGICILRDQSGGWVGTQIYTVEPSITVDYRLLNLTPGDLQFLQVNLNLVNLSLQGLNSIDLASLAAAISHSIFELGLPSHDILPGLSVSVGFGVRCTSSSAASATIPIGPSGAYISGSAQNVAKSGPSATAASGITLALSGISVLDTNLAGVLSDPRFSVLPDGRLGYFNQSGVLQPVAIVLDSGQREFYVFAGNHSTVTPVTVITPDDPIIACPSGTANLTVAASGTGPFTYQWRKGTHAINATSNPSAATATLILANVQFADAGGYNCIVANLCGSVISNSVTLKVCAADLNCDHTVDLGDFFDFLNCFDQSQPCADLDHNGDVDLGDFFAFLNSFDQGC